MQGPFCFVDDLRIPSEDDHHERKSDHFIRTTDEDGNGTGVCALFNNEHFVACRTKRQFTNDARLSKFLGSKILKSRHDTALSGDGNQLVVCLSETTIMDQKKKKMLPQFQDRRPSVQQVTRSASTSGWPRHRNPTGR